MNCKGCGKSPRFWIACIHDKDVYCSECGAHQEFLFEVDSSKSSPETEVRE
jgi:hypothetical protein